MLKIREATEADFEKIWPIFHAVASGGDTYAYPTDVTKAEGRRLMKAPSVRGGNSALRSLAGSKPFAASDAVHRASACPMSSPAAQIR